MAVGVLNFESPVYRCEVKELRVCDSGFRVEVLGSAEQINVLSMLVLPVLSPIYARFGGWRLGLSVLGLGM